MGKKRIVWADDDADDLMLVKQVLEEARQSYEVVEVNNGKEAVEYLEKASTEDNLPCLLILDMNMPIMNGRETLAFIKGEEQYKNLPIVVFTTSNSELDRLFCKRFNVEMITKPPSYTTLKDTINKLLSYCSDKH